MDCVGFGGIGEVMGGWWNIVGDFDWVLSWMGVLIGDSFVVIYGCIGVLVVLWY